MLVGLCVVTLPPRASAYLILCLFDISIYLRKVRSKIQHFEIWIAVPTVDESYVNSRNIVISSLNTWLLK